MSEKEIRPLGFESIFECIFVQPYVFKDVGLCKPKAASKSPFQEAWYLYGYVTIFLARPGILFKEYYPRQNTFTILINVSCSQTEPVTVRSRMSWWRKLCSCRWKPKGRHRYSCCDCACLLPALLFACHRRYKEDSGLALLELKCGVMWSSLVPCQCDGVVSLENKAAEYPTCAAE